MTAFVLQGHKYPHQKAKINHIYSIYLCDVVMSCFLTQRHDQEAEVIEPIRRLVGQLSDEELQHWSQITLTADHRHLHRPRHGRVTVTAAHTDRWDQITRGFKLSAFFTKALFNSINLQFLNPCEQSGENGLNLCSRTRTNHRMLLNLKLLRNILQTHTNTAVQSQ